MSTMRMSDETRRKLQADGLLDKAREARFNTLDPRVQGLPDDAPLPVPAAFPADVPDTWYASTPSELRRVIREVMEVRLPDEDPAEQDPDIEHEAEHAAAAQALGCTVRFGFTVAPFGSVWSWGSSIQICRGGPLPKLAFAAIAAAPARLSDGDLHDLRNLGYQDAADVADRIRRSGQRMPVPRSVSTGH